MSRLEISSISSTLYELPGCVVEVDSGGSGYREAQPFSSYLPEPCKRFAGSCSASFPHEEAVAHRTPFQVS